MKLSNTRILCYFRPSIQRHFSHKWCSQFWSSTDRL